MASQEVIDDITKLSIGNETKCSSKKDSTENVGNTANLDVAGDFFEEAAGKLEDEVPPNKNPDFIEDIDDETLQNREASMPESDKEKYRQEAVELKIEGNKEFSIENYAKSINLYTEALNICPISYKDDRSIFYCNRAAAKIKINYTETAIEDCSKAIELNPNYIKAYLRRAKLYETSDKLDESLNDFKKLLELEPSNNEARVATIRLPPLIHERNEKMKEDMLGN